MAVQIPSVADLDGEVYGLRTSLMTGEGYGDDSARDIFIHGRDYFLSMPSSPSHQTQTDVGQFTRTYRLWADNVFDGNDWTGRKTYVSAERQKRFEMSLLGYPYTVTVSPGGQTQLRRHLPEPLYSGIGGDAYTWIDTRGGGSIQRYEFHATRIIASRGIAEKGQNPDQTPVTWNPNTQSAIWTPSSPGTFQYPDEGYQEIEYTVLFERLPYEVMKVTDDYFAGEYSRFLVPQEEGSGRGLQVYGGVQWDTDLAKYGQPISGNDVSGTFATKEGAPKLVGEGVVTWRWMDVPLKAFNWAGTSGGIIGRWGQVNDAAFGATADAPFVQFGRECLLFQTAYRNPKPSITGEPLWDVVFCFRNSPAEDGYGYWNRVLNNKGYFQRYRPAAGSLTDFYKTSDFTLLFKSASYW